MYYLGLMPNADKSLHCTASREAFTYLRCNADGRSGTELLKQLCQINLSSCYKAHSTAKEKDVEVPPWVVCNPPFSLLKPWPPFAWVTRILTCFKTCIQVDTRGTVFVFLLSLRLR